MSASLEIKRRTPSPSASSLGVKIKSEYIIPDDYMNEVQDLRRRVGDSAESNRQSENNRAHSVHSRASPSPPAKRSEDETQVEERNGHDDRVAHEAITTDSRRPNGEAHLSNQQEQIEERNGHGHDRDDHKAPATDSRRPNGDGNLQDQQERRQGGATEREEMYERTTPVHVGEVRRNSSSREDAMEDSNRFSPAPETPDCNNQSDDMLVANNNETFQPCRDREGNLILDVDCGSNSAYLYINKLCQGSKGQSIYFNGKWLTPNEFQYISGRETAKDWKRSIRHRGKSLKILMSRGLLSVHTSAASECSNCKMNMAMTRVRYSDKRPASTSTLLTVPSSTTMTSLDKTHRRSVGETESGSLSQIINQLHQTNGFSDSSRKRALLLDSCGEHKRPRSISPMEDDIYEEQQRRIFQAANSPEPQMIENVRRSLNISTGDSHGSGPPSPASLSPPSLEDQVNTVPPDGDFILRSPHSMAKHQNKSSRKQISPQHIDLANADREASRSPHIMLGTGNSHNAYHKQAVMRQRYHSQAYNLSRNSSSITSNDTSRRTQSLVTPTAKSSDTPMIELTRPDLVTNASLSERSRASGVTSTSHVAEDGPVTSRLSTSDAVFFPSDMSSWGVDDVVQFVQSLKGCEEYAQLFQDQAIDGEILPVLTEDHLLHNMGMKLGPALKIRLHIAKRLGFTLNGQYCTLKTPYEEVH